MDIYGFSFLLVAIGVLLGGVSAVVKSFSHFR